MLTILFLTKYAKRPLHFFGLFGGAISLIGFFILIYLSIIHFLGQRIGDRPLLIFGMILVLAGFQVLFTGFIADLIININEKRNLEQNIGTDLKFES